MADIFNTIWRKEPGRNPGVWWLMSPLQRDGNLVVECLKWASSSGTHLTQVHTLSLSLYPGIRSQSLWVPFTILGAGSEAPPLSFAGLTRQQCGRRPQVLMPGLHFGPL